MSHHKKWTKIHYNAVAKEIRDLFPIHDPEGYRDEGNIRRATLSTLALSFAVRFKQDSDEAEEGYVFDPVRFLDACSPNTDLYPLSELWENYEC